MNIYDKAVKSWEANPDLHRQCTFHQYLAHQKRNLVDPMIEVYRLREGCSHKEALLAVSKRHSEYFR